MNTYVSLPIFRGLDARGGKNYEQAHTHTRDNQSNDNNNYYKLFEALKLIPIIINPRRMRSEGDCSCRVCVSVCLLFDNSLHEWLFASKTNTHIQRRMEVKKYVGFSLKLLRSRVMA